MSIVLITYTIGLSVQEIRKFEVEKDGARGYNMRVRQRAPLIIISTLIVILVFLGGIRYGREVERVNKTMNYLITTNPKKPTETPYPTPLSVRYVRYTSTGCATQFLYPDYLQPTHQSSQSARFDNNGSTVLAFSCELKKPVFGGFEQGYSATEAARVNILTGRRVYFKLDPGLLPLIDSSITYKK